MNERPLVSIVTPTLNQGRFIEATIRSIQAQTYGRYEHIVVDGGSTDETVDILRRLEGTYPMRWLSEPDGGMYDAVNKGLRLASGDILAYLNSDDLYFPWTLETVVQRLREQPEVDVVFGDALNVDDATAEQRVYWAPRFDLDDLRRFGFLPQPTVFWRRRLMTDVGLFDTSLRYVADCDYWMRAGERHRFEKVEEFLAVERNHSLTLHHTAPRALDEEIARVRSRYARTNGLRYSLAGISHAFRRRMTQRINWVRLVSRSRASRGRIAGPWHQFLAAGGNDLRVGRVPWLFLPVVGRRYSRELVRPSRRWLDPPAP
jgi:glycosyltransferase involved in cell wall biosynthesis